MIQQVKLFEDKLNRLITYQTWKNIQEIQTELVDKNYKIV